MSKLSAVDVVAGRMGFYKQALIEALLAEAGSTALVPARVRQHLPRGLWGDGR